MAPSAHRNALKPDYELHWYRIVKILGQGAFGITYLARDLNLDRDVAIKEYLPIDMAVREDDHSVHPMTDDHGKEFKWGLDRFISEARTLAKFDHQNIVRVHSVFEENNTGYMVMRYEEGKNFKEFIQDEMILSEEEILSILMPILNGLEMIHKIGFIHRDIKPDNIYIRADGSPVLIDFGSARQSLGEKTRTLTSVLTPGYAPIEQYYSKSDEQGPWTDIYSLGATIYRAITGIGLLDAVDRSKGILEISKDTFVPTMEICEGKYSVDFLRAIDHSLQFHKKDRPQSIQEWRHEFGYYTDKLSDTGRFEAETLVAQISDSDKTNFGAIDEISSRHEKTQVLKAQEKASANKGKFKPALLFGVILVIACGAAFMFPTQILKGITGLIFSSSDQDTEVVSEPSPPLQPVQEIAEISEPPPPVMTTPEPVTPEVDISKEVEEQRQQLVAERESIERERQRLERERLRQEQERLLQEQDNQRQEQEILTKENQLLQERLAFAEAEAKQAEAQRLQQEELARQEQERLAREEAEQLVALEEEKRRANPFGVFLENLIFPDTNTLYRGVLYVCDFYSEDDPTACVTNIDACKDFAQDDLGLFKFCATEYVNKLFSLSSEQ